MTESLDQANTRALNQIYDVVKWDSSARRSTSRALFIGNGFALGLFKTLTDSHQVAWLLSVIPFVMLGFAFFALVGEVYLKRAYVKTVELGRTSDKATIDAWSLLLDKNRFWDFRYVAHSLAWMTTAGLMVAVQYGLIALR